MLSASVTFLTLPAMEGDSIARYAGVGAVVFAVFAMASTVVVFLRYKNEGERANVGGLGGGFVAGGAWADAGTGESVSVSASLNSSFFRCGELTV